MENIMAKVISIILFGFFLYSNIYAQQETFGYRPSDNSDIVSDVFLIQDGFVLDSITSIIYNDLLYSFEYNNNGRLKSDFNFVSIPVLVGTRVIRVPGYRDYFYNERGDVDSIGYRYRNDSLSVDDSSGIKIDYSYDYDGKILSKTYYSDGVVTKTEENSYDIAGNLILNKVIDLAVPDTAYNIREYDAQNRLILTKSITGLPYFYQHVYQYDSSGNVTCKFQRVYPDEINAEREFYLEFDNSCKVIKEKAYRQFLPDSTWQDSMEILYDYDEYGRIIEMGPTYWFTYNADGNLDSLYCTHFILGYLNNRATFADSYGNSITLSSFSDIYALHYSRHVTGIKKSKIDQMNFTLFQNYPNPFNPTTAISWHSNVSGKVELSIYNILGQKVATPVSEKYPAGIHKVEWDAKGFPSGIYLYRIKARDFVQTKRMILMK